MGVALLPVNRVWIMIFARPNFLTALLFVAAALPASAAELERVEARFEIFGFAGLHVLTNRTHRAGARRPLCDCDGPRDSRPGERVCRSYESFGGSRQVRQRCAPSGRVPR